MNSGGWDVWCSKEDPNSLWFGYQIARGLTERQVPARLFTDQAAELSIAQRDVDPKLWMQAHEVGQIVDQRIASFVSPSAHIVQVFGSKMSRSYLGRFISQEHLSQWFQVQPPWYPGAGQAMHVLESTSSYRRCEARMGDVPACAGYVRQHTPSALQRRSGAWARQARSSTLNLLSLPQSLLDHDLFVFASGEAPFSFEPWAHALAATGQKVCLFVGAGALQQRLQPVVRLEAGTTGMATAGGAITVVYLPLLMWFVTDELMAACDLALTGRGDIAMRAAECGTPVVIGARTAAVEAFVRWYAPDAPAEQLRVYRQAAAAMRQSTPEDLAWLNFMAWLPEFQKIANGVQQRIGSGPELTDVLLAAAAGDGQDRVERFFAPTQPTEICEN